MIDERLLDAIYEYLPMPILARIYVRPNGMTALWTDDEEKGCRHD